MNPQFEYTQRPSGRCPVQAYGILDGHAFYFRSRGGHWYLAVAGPSGDPLEQDAWVHREAYNGRHAVRDLEIGDGRLYAAGWADEDECEAFIERAVAVYRTRK